MGHKSSVLSHLIIVRNCFRQKSFPACEKNLKLLLESFRLDRGGDLLEIGVGYTLTDSLILKYYYNFQKITINDINKIFHPRTYAFATIINPYNWTSKIFRFYLMRLIVILLLGKVGLRHMKYTYLLGNILDLNIAVPSVVYSNAVLEHIPPKMLNSLFKDLQAIGCESLIGIIDTNDHINRGLTPADQFKDFDGTDEEVQLRGNGLTHSQWKNIFQNVCSEGKIEQLTVNSSVVPGILVFDFRFESIN
jgi:hypothetical protein